MKTGGRATSTGQAPRFFALYKFLEKTSGSHADIPDTIEVGDSNLSRMSGLSVGDPSIIRKNIISENGVWPDTGSLRVDKITHLNQERIQYLFDVYNERSAILEFDGGLSREQAEKGALAEVIASQCSKFLD